jgi:hypothetical protein
LDLVSGVRTEERVADMDLVADPTLSIHHPECEGALALSDGTAHLAGEESFEIRGYLVDLGLPCVAHAARLVRAIVGSAKLLARQDVATDTRSPLLEKTSGARGRRPWRVSDPAVAARSSGRWGSSSAIRDAALASHSGAVRTAEERAVRFHPMADDLAAAMCAAWGEFVDRASKLSNVYRWPAAVTSNALS